MRVAQWPIQSGLEPHSLSLSSSLFLSFFLFLSPAVPLPVPLSLSFIQLLSPSSWAHFGLLLMGPCRPSVLGFSPLFFDTTFAFLQTLPRQNSCTHKTLGLPSLFFTFSLTRFVSNSLSLSLPVPFSNLFNFFTSLSPLLAPIDCTPNL